MAFKKLFWACSLIICADSWWINEGYNTYLSSLSSHSSMFSEATVSLEASNPVPPPPARSQPTLAPWAANRLHLSWLADLLQHFAGPWPAVPVAVVLQLNINGIDSSSWITIIISYCTILTCLISICLGFCSSATTILHLKGKILAICQQS